MNSSIRRASFGVMYCVTSNSRTEPPKRTGKADTSNLVIGPMPLSPRTMASQADFTVLPTGEMMPRPVTTTRRLLTRYLYEDPGEEGARAPCVAKIENSVAIPATVETGPDTPYVLRSGFGTTIVDVLNGLLDRGDFLGVLIGNLDLEFFFQSHDQLDCVERISSQIVHERRIVRDLFLLDAQLLGNDGFNLLLNCAH